MTDLLIVVGARPNFMKAAPIVQASKHAGLDCTLLHTGQHYTPQLSHVFFEELGLPRPDIELNVGSASHAQQTARIMLGFEGELERIDPAVVVVVGDVNSTLACALVAAKEHYPIAHIEAGLRSFDPSMPEEVNRRLTDHISTYLFTTSRDADDNLLREGIRNELIHCVGNTMIDSVLRFRDVARKRRAAAHYELEPDGYAVVTLHRPSNVDDPAGLARLLEAIAVISRCIPVVFPMHPRTRARLAEHPIAEALQREPGLIVCDPLGYLDFVSLVGDARLVLTDSGGIQEETTVLGIPCLTLRESTERPVTVTSGTNRVVGIDGERIVEEALTILEAPRRPGRIPELWDGQAGERIVEILGDEIGGGMPSTRFLAAPPDGHRHPGLAVALEPAAAVGADFD